MSGLWAIFASLLAVGLGGVCLWFKSAGDRSTGAQIEAGKVDAVTAVKQAAIAEAVANAPATREAVVDRLKAGTF